MSFNEEFARLRICLCRYVFFQSLAKLVISIYSFKLIIERFIHTPYSKMAATQDGLGRVARKRGIEGHGTQEILYDLRGNHREMDRRTANSGEKKTKTANITRCLHDFEKPRLFFRMNTFTRSRLTKIKVISIIDRATCFHSFKVREEPHNLKVALCIVSGEVEYAYCGPSCTAGKSAFCNHILALMCPLV